MGPLPLYRNAWPSSSFASQLQPTICPLLLMLTAALFVPPRVPMDFMGPLPLYRKARYSPSERSASPTICPLSLIAQAQLSDPLSVPRSFMGPLPLYRKARPSVADQPQPTIFPLLLMSQAVLYTLVLSSVPRSCMGPLPLYRKA